VLLYCCFTAVLLQVCGAAAADRGRERDLFAALLLLYCCFTAALLLLYCRYVAQLQQIEDERVFHQRTTEVDKWMHALQVYSKAAAVKQQ
jgi:hypothetical protein